MVDAEITNLKQEFELLIFSENMLKQECKEWQTKYHTEKEEVFRLSGASAKQNRKIKSLEDGTNHLRKQLEIANAKVASLEAQVKNVTGLQIGQKQGSEASTAQVRAALDTKDEKKMMKLKANLSVANGRVHQSELRKKGGSSEIIHPPAGQPSFRSQFGENQLEALRSQIHDLQQENTRLQNIHKGSRCEEFSQLTKKQLQDAKDSQAAAEARIFELEQEMGCLHAVFAETDKEVDEAGRVNSGSEVPPAHCDKPESRSASSPALALSDIQVTSVLPCPHKSSGCTLAADQDFRLRLEDLGKSILGLSDMPETPIKPTLPTKKTTNTSYPTPVPKLEVPVTINIQHSDRKNWRLIQHIQSAITSSSALEIQGPADLVHSLVTEMHRIEVDHGEKTILAAQWQKIAAEHRAEADALRGELDRRPNCVVAEHRYLADELEAKEMQWAMQEKLLAEWRKGAEGAN